MYVKLKLALKENLFLLAHDGKGSKRDKSKMFKYVTKDSHLQVKLK